ncbi:MAG: glutamine--fructose-6-phosphate transaminase (isomerizing) [Planctomycetota bacterium]|nr:MAG: glutamine--fructose-6-phosphate transaminase (isomerizing) [Planctomycetota bacterium]
MCGIIGYVGEGQATPILMDGLSRLEYRGYDSAGVAVLEGKRIKWEKTAGKLHELARIIKNADLSGTTGLGHTRWATHGVPSRENAHPHFTLRRRIALVHNGIIENHEELRRKLRKRNVKFVSQTDTEVLCHLIGVNYDGCLLAAVRSALKRVKGSYAIACISVDEPGIIVAARMNNPLIIGVASGGNLVASDIPAVLPYTRRVMFLDDGDVAEVRGDGVDISTLGGKPRNVAVRNVQWDVSTAEKGGYPHFMLKEIHEQPRAIAATIAGRINKSADDAVFADFGLSDAQLKKIERLSIISCGTSWHAGLVGKTAIEELARIPVDVNIGSEFRYADPILNERTLAVGISQSGETIDTLMGLRRAKESGAKALAICNVLGSSIPRMSDAVIYTHAGPEIGVASTKAYTTQLAALGLLAIRLGRLRGALKRGRAAELLAALRQIPRKLRKVTANDKLVKHCAERYKYVYDFLYIGRRYNYPTALEGALKLKELSYIHGEGYSAGEMKHGPIALVEDTFPTVAIAVKGRVYEKMLSNIQEIKARKGIVIALATSGDRKIRKLADFVITTPETEEMFSPILTVVPLQLLAYHIAANRGCDVDQPRNLAKSVTVE